MMGVNLPKRMPRMVLSAGRRHLLFCIDSVAEQAIVLADAVGVEDEPGNAFDVQGA